MTVSTVNKKFKRLITPERNNKTIGEPTLPDDKKATIETTINPIKNDNYLKPIKNNNSIKNWYNITNNKEVIKLPLPNSKNEVKYTPIEIWEFINNNKI